MDTKAYPIFFEALPTWIGPGRILAFVKLYHRNESGSERVYLAKGWAWGKDGPERWARQMAEKILDREVNDA